MTTTAFVSGDYTLVKDQLLFGLTEYRLYIGWKMVYQERTYHDWSVDAFVELFQDWQDQLNKRY